MFIAFIGLVNARLVVVPAFAVAVLKEHATAMVPPVTASPLDRPEAGIAGMVLLGCWREVHPLMVSAAGAFVLYFVLESGR